MSTVEIEDKSGGVRWLWLNRPESLNAINDELKNALREAIREASNDADVRVVVISGRGRAFSAGGDMFAVADRSPLATVSSMRATTALLNELVECTKPTVAAVGGLAVGAGASLVLACDLAIASHEAWFSFVFVERGLVPDCGATYFLPRIVGVSRAKALMLSARHIPANEAHDLGIVYDVVPQGSFFSRAQVEAEKLARGNVGVMPIIRRLVNHSFETDFRAANSLESLAQGVAVTSAEHQQSVTGFNKPT